MVEDVLVLFQEYVQSNVSCVLILVVVEDVLVLWSRWPNRSRSSSLNPCCGGRCSSTYDMDGSDNMAD